MKRSDELWVVLALVALAAIIRGAGIGWGLPEVYEEATPLKQAWDMWGWGSDRPLDLNPRFFNYPSLTIYLQFIVQALLYVILRMTGSIGGSADFQLLYLFDKTDFLIAARLVSAALGAVTVWFAYRLGRLFMSWRFAALAALLLAVNTLHIERSQMVEVDLPLTCLVVAAMWLFARLAEKPTVRLYVLAGITAGLAASTKYTGFALLLPLLVAHLFATRTSEGSSWRRPLLSVALVVVVFAVTSPYVLLDLSNAWRHIAAEGEHMETGHFGSGAVATWRYYLDAAGGRLFGWPVLILAVVGLIYFTALRARPWAAIAGSFLVPYVVVVSSWQMQAERYLLPVLPIVIVYAVALFYQISRTSRVASWRHAGRTAAFAVVALVLLVPQARGYPDLWERQRPDTRTMAKVWIEEHVPPGSLVVTEQYGPELFGPGDFWRQGVELRTLIMSSEEMPAVYGVHILPLFSVNPHLTTGFYDVRLYETADLIITSSAVKGRYLKEPERFSRQLAFYDILESTYGKLREFVPNGARGPTITIYWNRTHEIPFAQRGDLPPPVLLDPAVQTRTGEEGFFYLQMGLNCEFFGYFQDAITYYDRGIAVQRQRRDVYRDLAVRRAWVYNIIKQPRRAAESLRAAAQSCPWPDLQKQLLTQASRVGG